MSINSCLNRMAAQNLISKSQITRLSREAEVIKNRLLSAGSTETEEVLAENASKQAVEAMLTRLDSERLALSLQQTKLIDSQNFINSFKEGPVVGLRRTLNEIEYDQQGILGTLTAPIGEFIEASRSKIPGGIDLLFTQHKELMHDTMKALAGDSRVSKISKEFASSIDAVYKTALTRLANAGVKTTGKGPLSFTRNWAGTKIVQFTKEEFVQDMSNAIDKSKAYKADGKSYTDAELIGELSKAYDALAYPSKDPFNRASNSLEIGIDTHLPLKNADNYINLNQKYGNDDIYTTVMRDLHDISTEIALAERLGPHYRSTFRQLDSISGEFSSRQKGFDILKQQLLSPENPFVNNRLVFNVLSGKSEGIANASWANLAGGLRNLSTSAMLPYAALSSVMDYGNIKSSSEFWGLSFNKIFGNIIKDIVVPGNATKTRRLAARLSQSMDYAQGPAYALQRQSDIAITGKFSRITAQMADFVTRSTGLSALQHKHEKIFGLELNGFLTGFSSKSFDKLPTKVQKSLEYGNIDAKLWDEIRTKTTEIDGLIWLDPLAMSEEASTKFVGLISRYTKIAVPVPGAEARALMTGGSASGSLDREVRAMLTQFQGFLLGSTLRSLQTLLFHPALNGNLSKAGYASRLAVYSTLTGALSLQLNSLARGKDLENTNNPEFWVKAAMTGGTFGLGFYQWKDADQQVSITPEDLSGGFMPPSFRPIFQVMATFFNTKGALEQGDTDKALTKAVKGISKVQFMNTWMTDLITTRLIEDKLQQMVDPNYGASLKRRLDKLKKSTGQEFYWKPGDTLPERAPQISEPPEE